jgi:hypothetical protein
MYSWKYKVNLTYDIIMYLYYGKDRPTCRSHHRKCKSENIYFAHVIRACASLGNRKFTALSVSLRNLKKFSSVVFTITRSHVRKLQRIPPGNSTLRVLSTLKQDCFENVYDKWVAHSETR